MEWLDNNMWLVWLGLAFVLIAIEAATVDFVFVMIAGGALAGAISAGLGAPVGLQVVIAVVVALLLIVLVRPIAKRQLLRNTADTTIGSASLAGRVARVVETVTETDGRVHLAGETWSARVPAGSQACAPGDEVRVVAIEGATAVVTQQPVV